MRERMGSMRAGVLETLPAAAFAAQSAAQILRFGLQQHQAGRLDQAEAAYRQILAVAPQEAEVLHLLGVVAYQRGQHDSAVASIGQAIALRGDRPPYYGNMALALRGLGRLAEAEANCRTALRLDPAFVDALGTLGAILRGAGRLAEAEACLRDAVRQRPGFAEAHNNLGTVLREQRRPDEAVASFRTALTLLPDNPQILTNLASALLDLNRQAEAEETARTAIRLRPHLVQAHFALGNILVAGDRSAEAEASYRMTVGLDPGLLEAHHQLGKVLSRSGRPAEAEQCFRTALTLKPDYAGVVTARGFALVDLGRLAEAEAAYRSAIQLEPELAEAHYGLGNVLVLAGRLREAEASYRVALGLDPDHVRAHFNLGHVLLATGRLVAGWPHYDRWVDIYPGGRRAFTVPLWQGEPIGDRVLLLHAEQGFGDTLQFCRYIPLVAGGATVVVEVQQPLRRLLSTMPGIARVVAQGGMLPHFDLHCPLTSLPRVFGTMLETVPCDIPYLAADPARVTVWRQRLDAFAGLRVGLVWAGGIRPDQPGLAKADARRSVTLGRLAPIAAVPGITFVSLQKGPPAAEAAHPPNGMVLHDFTAELTDFADTAALVEALDLVISVDTAVAHLAGALGKPVWLLNRFDTCWRWLQDRDDSPWYPTLRLFRQPAPGDWDSVMQAVAAALAQVSAA
jgi:tetratricopeptide (TPR) repeat protein